MDADVVGKFVVDILRGECRLRYRIGGECDRLARGGFNGDCE